jgi:hypothetical protein
MRVWCKPEHLPWNCRIAGSEPIRTLFAPFRSKDPTNRVNFLFQHPVARIGPQGTRETHRRDEGGNAEVRGILQPQKGADSRRLNPQPAPPVPSWPWRGRIDPSIVSPTTSEAAVLPGRRILAATESNRAGHKPRVWTCDDLESFSAGNSVGLTLAELELADQVLPVQRDPGVSAVGRTILGDGHAEIDQERLLKLLSVTAGVCFVAYHSAAPLKRPGEQAGVNVSTASVKTSHHVHRRELVLAEPQNRLSRRATRGRIVPRHRWPVMNESNHSVTQREKCCFKANAGA